MFSRDNVSLPKDLHHHSQVDSTSNWVFSGFAMINKQLASIGKRFFRDVRGGVLVEYLLLLTIVGIGAIAGLGMIRGALLNELIELAEAIQAITP